MKQIYINIILTEEEKQFVKDVADYLAIAPSSFIRMITLEKCREIAKKMEDQQTA